MDRMLPPAARTHLFVTDLDGTLLDSDGRVPPMSARIISELSHQGALITFATARTPATVDRLLCHTFTRLPVIVMTGAALWDRRHRRYINTRMLPPAAATRAINMCRARDINPFIYTLGRDSVLHVYHNGPMSAKESRFVADRTGLLLKQFHLDEPRGLADSFPSTMFLLAMGPLGEIMATARELRTMPDVEVSAYPDNYNPLTGVLEIFAAGVSKAAAIRKLARECGATRVTVFGDNLNDLSMLRVADESVAVANAMPEVLSAASLVIGPNTDESVARHILSTLQSY